MNNHLQMDSYEIMESEWLTLTPDTDITARISRIIGCHHTVAKLLVNRGITTPEEAFTFLNPSLSHLTDPFALKDMQKAVERIYTAICNKEKILVFGDFDADGITATVVLNNFFNHVEADVSWYIPHRIREGYSLKLQHVQMAVEQRCDLLITVDCGSDSHEAVRAAIKEDIDIIITDHHEIRGFRPPAFAVVNPKQKDCEAGLEHLAGVGVAFYLVTALRSYLRQKEFWIEIPEPNLMEYCDLVAIGTIADMVPLKAENRILAKAGISVMQKGKREGLNALIKISGLEQGNIKSDDISFRIAPRLNAAGRISHSRICVDLLSEKSGTKAEQTAFILEELNKKRQDIEKSIVDEIEQRVALNPKIIERSSIVMEDKRWNAGVLGIAASRIAKKYYRPVVLISTASLNPYSATGSCRSIGTLNIHSALSRCSALLENFGGHTMAAGISIKPENIAEFAERFEDEIIKLLKEENIAISGQPVEFMRSKEPYRLTVAGMSDDFTHQMVFDANLDLDEITDKLAYDIERLGPYGTDNPEPLFCCSDVRVLSSFMIGSRHRKMVLQQINGKGEQSDGSGESESGNKSNGKSDEKGKSIEALHFNIKSSIQEQDETVLLPDSFNRIAFRVKMNRFSGKNRPQIIIEQTNSDQ